MTEDLEIFSAEECPQYSEEWWALRLGIPTASVAATVSRSGDSKTRAKLMRILAGEIISGTPSEEWAKIKSAAMKRGHEMEESLLSSYALAYGDELSKIGFVRRAISDPIMGEIVIGASPDALIGKEGGVEIKSVRPDLMIEMIESRRFPIEHVPQVQWSMWVTGRQWWEIKIGYRGMPALTFPVQRDDVYIAELRQCAFSFVHDLRKLVARIKGKLGEGRG